MSGSLPSGDHITRDAAQVADTFRVADGIYLLGSLERGVTLYNQQLRAHNLAWALWEMDRARGPKLGKVAVIGGGAAGLTITAGLLSRYNGAVPITLFENRWDLCPLQQGSDTRWLHPRIYAWPDWGSRAPGASLPVLNWSEGRASDVARSLVRGFGEFCESFSKDGASPAVIFGLAKLDLRALSREIEYSGVRGDRVGPFFRHGSSCSGVASFDTVILACGFGTERPAQGFETNSYWRNEQLGQPSLGDEKQRYLISGYGDGALVDLCRVRIERFRQDTILYEIFGDSLEHAESVLRKELTGKQECNLFDYFKSLDRNLLQACHDRLTARLRKDTEATLYIGGREQKERPIEEIFGPTSSRLNRLLTYLLLRAGAFTPKSGPFGSICDGFRSNNDHVVCRHGPDTRALLKQVISDYKAISPRLDVMETNQAQMPKRLWLPGAFPEPKRGTQR